ncbi:carnitine dehydratase [Comamonas serinivorans]|uniref:Carnitine dehydratase n=1 Tax=Comamonas serinivorans TaxID=1082851 RepID=A0A1Y0EL80_9BURK|nr:CaiB/BaiF CoA-transferase family protein [Comamonas serinivorans]ARU04393.1 carnitine dehydratase [Comamonas serinivorans]
MGPLNGLKIIELAGIGPSPFGAMQLADMGATVLRIDRREPADLGVPRELKYAFSLRNRKTLALDLKDPQAIALVLELVAEADVLIEGFRPGVTERLGLGPDACLARNPKLVYGRMTGWGQDGPLAQAAGHDINYIALTGALNAIGRKGGPPTPPLALVGDMGGGGMFLAMGVLAAVLHARQTGQGQVVDASIVDGAASLCMGFYGMTASGQWTPERGTNVLDSGAPYYDVYECSDGRWISIGPIEARFFADFLQRVGLPPDALGVQNDRAHWPQAKVRVAQVFKTKTCAEWCDLLEGTDVCFAPVLSFAEAPQHPHLKARGSFVEVDGLVQPAPAVRFSATPSALPTGPRAPEGATAVDGWLAPERQRHWQAQLGD